MNPDISGRERAVRDRAPRLALAPVVTATLLECLWFTGFSSFECVVSTSARVCPASGPDRVQCGFNRIRGALIPANVYR